LNQFRGKGSKVDGWEEGNLKENEKKYKEKNIATYFGALTSFICIKKQAWQIKSPF
jgi:hypothetical protein